MEGLSQTSLHHCEVILQLRFVGSSRSWLSGHVPENFSSRAACLVGAIQACCGRTSGSCFAGVEGEACGVSPLEVWVRSSAQRFMPG